MTTRRRKAASPTPDRVAGQIRTLLAAAGGAAVALGVTDEATATELIGAGAVIVPMVWSWLSKP